MPIHTVSVLIAVVQFVSYVVLSSSIQYIYYYRQVDQPERWKSQPSKLRVVAGTVAQRAAAVAPLPEFTPTSIPSSDELSTVSSISHLSLASSTVSDQSTRPSSTSLSPSSLGHMFVCWMYPTKWLLFPLLPRVPHRHPYHSFLTTFNLTLSACVAGCVTETFMRDRSALLSHTHFLPAFALPSSFFPSASRPSVPHVICTLLVSVLWQCVCE